MSPTKLRRRLSDESGAAVVETAFLLPVLFIIVFGMITFGLILGFKQTTEEAASEGARASLIKYVNEIENGQTAATAGASARVAGRTAAANSMSGWEPTCDNADADADGFGCWAYTHDCTYTISGVLDPSITEATYNTVATPDCITVVVFHDYDGSPFLPQIPLIDAFMPDSISSAATVQVTD